jgi:hypothetical protein
MKRTFIALVSTVSLAGFAAVGPVAAVAFARGNAVDVKIAPQQQKGAPAPTAAPVPDPPTVPSLGGMLEKGVHFGMSHAQITNVYNKIGGIIDVDVAPLLATVQPGTDMQNIKAAADAKKAAFASSWTEFGDLPLGFDSLPIKHEYTYKNHESVQKIARNGHLRYFFYINDKLWKVYDEYPLGSGSSLGNSYSDAIARLGSALGASGRARASGSTPTMDFDETDWVDKRGHLRALNRGSKVIALVLEDLSTSNRIASMRTNTMSDPTAIDPSIAAVTKGGVSDPNAAQPMPSASAKPKRGR